MFGPVGATQNNTVSLDANPQITQTADAARLAQQHPQHAQHAQPEMLSLMTAQVRDAVLRKPFYLDGGLNLIQACEALSAQNATHALVQDGERLGLFTTTDLRDALLLPAPPQQVALREVARFDLIEVQAESEIFEALWLMVRHRVHRLVVRDGTQVLGVLGQLDLVSLVAHHSHVVALQIDQAHSVDELAEAAARLDQMVRLLHQSGTRVERITRLVSEINARLFERAWSLIAPPALVANSCLLVMGSEGRGEQILKTDQDNALLLRDGFECAELGAATQTFSAALARLGYPPCPGGIMLTQPLWCQSISAFKETIRGWLYGHDADAPMHLAIFFDATAVAGDAALLVQAKAHLARLMGGHDAFLARFAAAADQFQEPGNWFTRLAIRRDDVALDLKKLGTFPIVHGVRALALQYGVTELGTAARLERLVALNRLDAAQARSLTDALHFFMTLRLSHQLGQIAGGRAPGNSVKASALGVLEREPLHHALAIVKAFRAHLRQHFKFDSL